MVRMAALNVVLSSLLPITGPGTMHTFIAKPGHGWALALLRHEDTNLYTF